MSVYAKVWAYEQHPLQVDGNGNPKPDSRNPAAKAVLVALAEFPGIGQRECWPAQATLAAMTDFEERTVRKHLDVLEKQGYIKRSERRKKGQRLTDMVTLLGPVEAFGPTTKPPERHAGSTRGSHRNVVPEPPERHAGEPSLEPSGSRRDADASFETRNWFTFYCELAKQLDVIITPEDRKATASHFKDLVRLREPTEAEMKKLISKMLEARASGYDMSPQKALGKVRGSPSGMSNVVQLRREPESRPGGGLRELQ